MNCIGNRRWIAGRRPCAKDLGLAAFVVGTILLAHSLRAEDAAQAAQAARLSSVDGQVRISQGTQVLADQALANSPLFEGTRVATSEDGKAEIQFEDGSVARLAPNSTLILTVLRGQSENGFAEMVLEGGLGYFELQGKGQAGHLRVRFGESVVMATGLTILRISLDRPPGELAVFSGNAHLERANSLALDLHGGESVALDAVGSAPYHLAESIEPDSWDSWNTDRDKMLTAEASAHTGATDSLGDNNNPAWSDLDANGNWYQVPDQGYVWSPYEAADAGWDPYGNGHWMWTPRFGYIWVSGSSWGYMPYQCGYWNYYDSFGWGWAPGLAGCRTWWGTGRRHYGINIGYAPGSYRPPMRPRPPHRIPPGGGGGNPGRHPVFAVNRGHSGRTPGLPMRDRTSPVTIAGHTVAPLRPLSSRPQYNHSASGFVNRTQPASPGTAGRGTGPARTTGPAYMGNRPASSYVPRNSAGSGNPYKPAQSHTYSGGGYSGGGSTATHSSSGGYSGGGSSASHSSGGGYSGSGSSASHSSGGGYSGGGSSASHSSGGGYSGGGGGGGSHSSGGGSSGSGPHH